jgi:hypothetical protein
VELSVVAQRYLAVREALDTGATIADIAQRYGIDRRTIHRWLTRYASGGLGALAGHSSKPDRCPHQICLNNGIRHLLTAPYSPTTTGKIERLHKTMRKEFFADRTFASIAEAQTDLDAWVRHYNHEREHQAIGDVAPIRRFELAEGGAFEIISGDVQLEQELEQARRVVGRRVDQAGRISILKHRYHVGRHLAGQRVAVESQGGLLHVTRNGVVIATHARRHLADDDDKMDRRSRASRPARPTAGDEVLRKVDSRGGVSFAGTNYRVGNRYRGQTVGVRLVGDTGQITQDETLLRTHRARHDKAKEFGALGNPTGRPRRAQDVA